MHACTGSGGAQRVESYQRPNTGTSSTAQCKSVEVLGMGAAVELQVVGRGVGHATSGKSVGKRTNAHTAAQHTGKSERTPTSPPSAVNAPWEQGTSV